MDLSLVSMDEIYAELNKRFDTVLVLTRRKMTDDIDDINYHVQDKVGCLGLIQIAKIRFVQDYEDKETEGFKDGD